MSNGDRCGDVQILRHAHGYGSEAFDLIGMFMGRWSSRMVNKWLRHCFQTLFKI